MDARAARGQLTYPQVGLTRVLATEDSGEIHWPPGCRGVDISIEVGSGAGDFHALADGILTWQIQRRAGLTVHAAPTVEAGGRVVSGFGVGRVRLPVPCEVVWVEPVPAEGTGEPACATTRLAGFGYGTLPGHPASGEEAFVATMDEEGIVRFRLLAFSRPAGLVFKLGSPVTTLTQKLVTRNYLAAAASLVAAAHKRQERQ
ncbi:DUF1990 family protein [Arthrobacter sp. 35W]|uniref:DUF1990 family protein n=1 Tax=Arthrobacter sp. 35W TaxID=1132441 RepID=UPI00047E171E|nr:DUF1990 domain-containing protein [Arthrobacter sp. 35W]